MVEENQNIVQEKRHMEEKVDEPPEKRVRCVSEVPSAPSDVEKEVKKSVPTAEQLLQQGFAPIKGEHLLLHVERPPDSGANGSNHEKVKVGVNRTGKSRKQLRKEKIEKQNSKQSLCSYLLRGDCTFGDTCKFNHDVDGYLAQKPPDLPGRCPFYAAQGKCKFGIACRYASSHNSEDNTAQAGKVDIINLSREKILTCRLALDPPNKIVPEINILKRDLQLYLRRKKVAFPNAEAKLSEMKIKSNKHFKTKGNEPAYIVGRMDNEAGSVQKERKKIDFRNKLYLSPLTTVGNLPFRRICKTFGVDITCGEMAMATNILQGHASEWALLKRHPSEDIFGVQLAGAYADSLARAGEIVSKELDVDFIDINMGCPIDLLCHKGGGAALLQKPSKIETLAKCLSPLLDCPLTLKMRKGYNNDSDIVHTFIERVSGWGVSALTLHGRTREQRYTKNADWDYIDKCAQRVSDLTLIGNGDIFSYVDYNKHMESGNVSTVMIGRGALIKPWIFTEIKEQRHYDISASERFDIMKSYCSYGLEHWGSDSVGVETTRRFLLEWLSFLHRYVPVGLLEVLPQSMNMRPPAYYARNDLETLLASNQVDDWVKISEMLLGPTPDTFSFVPKHKSNAYRVVGTNIEKKNDDFGEQNG